MCCSNNWSLNTLYSYKCLSFRHSRTWTLNYIRFVPQTTNDDDGITFRTNNHDPVTQSRYLVCPLSNAIHGYNKKTSEKIFLKPDFGG